MHLQNQSFVPFLLDFFLFHFLAKFEHTVALIKVFFPRLSESTWLQFLHFYLGHLEMKLLWGCNTDMAA